MCKTAHKMPKCAHKILNCAHKMRTLLDSDGDGYRSEPRRNPVQDARNPPRQLGGSRAHKLRCSQRTPTRPPFTIRRQDELSNNWKTRCRASQPVRQARFIGRMDYRIIGKLEPKWLRWCLLNWTGSNVVPGRMHDAECGITIHESKIT